MNLKPLFAAAVFAASAGAAFADDITLVADTFVAQKTRAEVKAEVLAARKAGTLAEPGEAGYPQPAAVASTLTRDQVRAEARRAPRVFVGEAG